MKMSTELLATTNTNYVFDRAVDERIFFLLYIKYPMFMYVNYNENAKLLAWWLDVEDKDREFDGTDGYCLNQLCNICYMKIPQVIEKLYAAIQSYRAYVKVEENDTPQS
jgi:hypothetical protein